MYKRTFIAAAIAMFSLGTSAAAPKVGNDVIKLNQVGYYPDQEKIVVVEGNVSTLCVLDAEGRMVMRAPRMAKTLSPISRKQRSTFDLSRLAAGSYTLVVGKHRVPMNVSPTALESLGAAAIKSFYYQRTAMPLTAEYAGVWARPAGHPDTEVYIHPAAASRWRPAGTVISSPKGWYDAGDYNKYVVNSAYAMGLMLSMYELIPDYFEAQNAGLPESQNGTADLLDENMWNLDWLFTAQDYDGGAYHKLTTPNFESFIRPTDCRQPRYMTQKTTCATLDLAAIMAKCARLYANNKVYPDVSVRALNAARQAYEWARRNPEVYYEQDKLNAQYEPKVTTGAYDDMKATDEFFWAATELYLATGERQYLEDAEKYAPTAYAAPSWGDVAGLGTYALAAAKDLPQEALALQDQQKQLILGYAAGLKDVDLRKTAFYSTYGNQASDFFWGCNSEGCGVQGVTLLFAYRLTDDRAYLQAAYRDADYLLGRNATGYCYVTGFGQKSPMHPHHRLSASDDIEAPIPGLLVGGPNPGKQDQAEVTYDSDFADECYSDYTPSYASNEIAINWSATLVALINGLIAMSR